MAEIVVKSGINREKDYLYYVKPGAIWRVHRKEPGQPKYKPEKVADAAFDYEDGFMYFVDGKGNVARTKRAVGGQKRKAAKKPAAKRPAKKAAAKGKAKGKAKAKKGKKKGKR